MLQYLIILLDDTSTSYCHYSVLRKERRLISIEDLQKGILFAMKENLTIQFVYPDYPLPPEYEKVIDTIDHVAIRPGNSCMSDADISVFDCIDDMIAAPLDKNKSYVVRLNKDNLFSIAKIIIQVVTRVARLNVVITDIDSFSEEDFKLYKAFLEKLIDGLEIMYANGLSPQLNLVTDRILLDKMNNCNAGDTNITLAPDGRLYPCPAFYYETPQSKFMGLGGPYDAPFSIGNLRDGIEIKNKQLYKISHAPLCRICDAYQCKRCIWMNRRMTREVNTPSHEQCVVAHLERNAAKLLLEKIRTHGSFRPEQTIKEISYLDPFEVKEDW